MPAYVEAALMLKPKRKVNTMQALHFTRYTVALRMQFDLAWCPDLSHGGRICIQWNIDHRPNN